MTYLDICNGVLRRLREDEVTNVSADAYSKMVGDFINDAKDLVETAWDWSALRSTLTITTSADDNLYSLTGFRSEGKLLNLINDTSNLQMEYQTQEWFDDKEYIQQAVTGAPQYYTYSGLDASDDCQIKIYPTPGSQVLSIENINFSHIYDFKIVDMFGREVKNFTVSSEKNTKMLVDTSKLSDGLYFIFFNTFEDSLDKRLKFIVRN